MSGNIKLRWFLLAPILLALFVVTSPVISMELDFDIDGDIDINVTGTKITLENIAME